MEKRRYRGGARTGPASPVESNPPAAPQVAAMAVPVPTSAQAGGGRKKPATVRLPKPNLTRDASPGELVRLIVRRDPGAHTWPPMEQIPQDAKDRYKRDLDEWKARCANLPAGIQKPKKPKPPWKTILSLSVNDWDHVHFRQREKLRLEILERVYQAIQAQRPPRFYAGRPKIFLVYYFRSNARRDWGNWTGKHLLDALRDWGVILEDNDRAIDNDRPLLLVDPADPRVEFWILDTAFPPSPGDQAAIDAVHADYQRLLAAGTKPKQQKLDLGLGENDEQKAAPGHNRRRRRRGGDGDGGRADPEPGPGDQRGDA